jgi:hypothetical protein
MAGGSQVKKQHPVVDKSFYRDENFPGASRAARIRARLEITGWIMIRTG